jgi:hypothetical protein
MEEPTSEGTNGTAESKSFIVRSGMMTSFCATTLVTPSLLTVFITTTGQARSFGKGSTFQISSIPKVDHVKTEKIGGDAFHFYGVSPFLFFSFTHR